MGLKVKGEDGELLWSPEDFGDYSIEKIQLISSILKELLSSITLSTKNVDDIEDKSGYYTKDESDNRFLLAGTASDLISTIARQAAEAYLSGGGAVSTNDFTQVRNWLIRLNKLVEGVDLDNPKEAEGNYITLRIESLENKEKADASNILAIQRDVYKQNSDGSVSSEVRFALLSDMGITKDINGKIITSLDKSFDVYRTTIVDAINYLMKLVQEIQQIGAGESINNLESRVDSLESKSDIYTSDISELESKVGIEELETNAGTIKEAINEVNRSIQDISSNIGDIENISESISSRTSIVDALNDIANSISSIEMRLSALESNSASV